MKNKLIIGALLSIMQLSYAIQAEEILQKVIKYLISHQQESGNFLSKRHEDFVDYPYGSYLPFRHPRIEKTIKKVIDECTYSIYICSADSVVAYDMFEKKSMQKNLELITALLTDSESELCLARFRVYLDDQKGIIYATSLVDDSDKSKYRFHEALLQELENFLKERGVVSVKNAAGRKETGLFFSSCGYCDKEVYANHKICDPVVKKFF